MQSKQFNLEIKVAQLDERIANLEKWQIKQNGLLTEIQHDLRRLREDWAQRPSWAVALLISLLSSACVGMALYIITGK